MHHARDCRHRIGQDLSVSIQPPSRACHKDFLPQVDLGTVGILHHRLMCMFPCAMFSVYTASRIVGQKRQSTILRGSPYDPNYQVSGRSVTPSRFNDYIMD